MEPSVYGLILLIIIILIGSACCSGVEAAFLAVNSIRILEIASKQKPKSTANQLLKLRKHLGRTLTVITITNNGFNIIGSLILGVYGALVINSSFGLTLFSIVFYILVVLVGEVLPKALGTRFSLQIALLSVPILRILNILMRPFLIWELIIMQFELKILCQELWVVLLRLKQQVCRKQLKKGLSHNYYLLPMHRIHLKEDFQLC